MCGISGFVSPSKKYKEADLMVMTDCIRHRGPDADGYFYEEHGSGSIAMGHRRLSIIDLSVNGNQPMYSSCGRTVMVYNGEVYNFKEIQRQLLPGHPLKSNSDSEVILESFAKLGIEAVSYWNGMFAAAIWDKQQHTLTLIRDRVGKKSIFYYWNGTEFAFASELKAIKTLHPRLTLNKQAVADYLNLGYVPHPATIYNEAFKLEAGSYITLKEGRLQEKKYWSPEEGAKRKLVTNEATAKEELKSLLVSAVKYRMISDVPFGTFLSGGVDSSLVTAIAQSLSSVPVKTFSVGFAESSFDESRYAQQVATILGTDHHQMALSEAEGIHRVDDIAGVYDEPYADVSAVPTMMLSQFTRQHITMALSGDGGDELFLGYGTYTWAQRLRSPLLWAGRHLIAQALSHGKKRHKRAAWIFDAPSKENLQQHIFSQEQGFFSSEEIRSHFDAGDPSPLFSNNNNRLNAAEQQALFDFKYYLPDDLMVKTDRASMRYSLEIRTPILDYRIVEFAYNLHPDLKKKGTTAKYLLKEILYDYLPRDIFARPKWGFAFPLEKLLAKELHHLIDEYLAPSITRQIGLCDEKYIEMLKTKYATGETFVYYKLWTVIQLHKWYKENIL